MRLHVSFQLYSFVTSDPATPVHESRMMIENLTEEEMRLALFGGAIQTPSKLADTDPQPATLAIATRARKQATANTASAFKILLITRISLPHIHRIKTSMVFPLAPK